MSMWAYTCTKALSSMGMRLFVYVMNSVSGMQYGYEAGVQ